MSLYKALIDFRDNNNDAMWIRQEDDKDMVSVIASNSKNRGKSWLMIKFHDFEDYINLLVSDSDHNNNSLYISLAFGGGYYGGDSVFVDTYHEAQSSWEEGFIFSYFDDENKQLFNEIIKLTNPIYNNYCNMGYDQQQEVGEFFYSNFNDEADNIGWEYASEYDSALLTGLREHVESGFCDVLKDFRFVKKVCGKEYLTTVDNLLNLWDSSGASEFADILTVLKEFISENSLQIDEDLGEDYYAYYSDDNFDKVSFNRNANRTLDKLHDKILEDYDPEDAKNNIKIVKLIDKYKLSYKNWNDFPSEKFFEKDKPSFFKRTMFKIEKIDRGQIHIIVNTIHGARGGWYDYEEFVNFLLHPELFN